MPLNETPILKYISTLYNTTIKSTDLEIFKALKMQEAHIEIFMLRWIKYLIFFSIVKMLRLKRV